MNIEYINAIPLCQIFDKLKLNLPDNNGHYPSPFRQEITHTLKVNHGQNTWSDSAIQAGGGPLELIAQWLRYQNLPCSIPDILHWFRFNIGYPSMQDGITLPAHQMPEVKFAYKSFILNPVLIRYVEKKHIPLAFVRKHLSQIGITNVETGEEFSALGMKTEEGGWWVNSPYINTFTGSKSISYIHGRKHAFRAVHIFRDIYDYEAAKLAFNNGQPFDDESILLNSYACLDNSAAYIRGFGYRKLYTWLDNGRIGKKATENYAFLCRTENKLQHVPMNYLYASCRDIGMRHKQLLAH